MLQKYRLNEKISRSQLVLQLFFVSKFTTLLQASKKVIMLLIIIEKVKGMDKSVNYVRICNALDANSRHQFFVLVTD